MAVGYGPNELDSELGAEPLSHHYDDGTVESAAEGWRQKTCEGIVISDIDTWRAEVLEDGTSEASSIERVDEWECKSLAVGESLIGGRSALPSQIQKARIKRYRASCEGLRNQAEKRYNLWMVQS